MVQYKHRPTKSKKFVKDSRVKNRACNVRECRIITFLETYTMYVLFTWHLTNVIISVISFQNDPENDILFNESSTPEATAEMRGHKVYYHLHDSHINKQIMRIQQTTETEW